MVRALRPVRQPIHVAPLAARNECALRDASCIHARAAYADGAARLSDDAEHVFDPVIALRHLLARDRATDPVAEQKDADLLALASRECAREPEAL